MFFSLPLEMPESARWSSGSSETVVVIFHCALRATDWRVVETGLEVFKVWPTLRTFTAPEREEEGSVDRNPWVLRALT